MAQTMLDAPIHFSILSLPVLVWHFVTLPEDYFFSWEVAESAVFLCLQKSGKCVHWKAFFCC